MPQGWTPGPIPDTSAWTPGPAPGPDFRTSNEKTAGGDAVVDPNTIGTFVRHFWDSVNPIQIGQLLPFPKAAGGSGMDNPLNPVKVVDQLHAVKQEGDARWAKGDKIGASAKYLESIIPILGPLMSHWGNQLEAGQYAAVGGDVLGMTAAAKVPDLIRNVPPMAANPNPADAAAVQFGQSRGIPVDAGTATGNRFVKAAQTIADHSPIGSFVAEDAKTATGTALRRVSGDLADDARGAPMTAEQAGRGLTQALTGKADAHAAMAANAYQNVEQAATQLKLDVPTTGVKQMLTPLYDSLKRQAQLTPNAVMGDKATALNAIDRLMSAGDTLPLMDAEDVLGGLKGLSRLKSGQIDATRTPGQAAASVAVRQLQAAVDTTAARGGILRDLQTGRAATAAKFSTADVLDLIKDEPVQAFRQATAAKDSGIELLRSIAREVPQAVPQIARAKLDDLFAPVATDGFSKGLRLQSEWQKLGSETKQILFPQPGQTQALDNFFRLTQKLAESDTFNSSRSGVIATTAAQVGAAVKAPAIGIPALAATGVLSKLLHSRMGVNLLTRGVTLSLAGNAPAAAIEFSRAAQLAQGGSLGMAPTAIPAVASQPTGATQP